MAMGKILGTLPGTCRYCGEKAGRTQQSHPECEQAREETWRDMVQEAAQAAGTLGFCEASLRQRAGESAARYPGDPGMADRAVEEGWKQAIRDSSTEHPSAAFGERWLRAHRDRTAAQAPYSDPDPESMETTGGGPAARLALMARITATAHPEGEDALDQLQELARDAGMTLEERQKTLAAAWETAVEGSLESAPLTLDEENALVRYRERFGLSAAELDLNGVHTAMIKSAALREAARGNMPTRQSLKGPAAQAVPKSEKGVWVFEDAEHFEEPDTAARAPAHPAMSHRVHGGSYERPGSFRLGEPARGRQSGVGTLALTDRALHFTGEGKKVRIPYDRIRNVEPQDDGARVTQDDPKARPCEFVTGDGWFIFNLLNNLRNNLRRAGEGSGGTAPANAPATTPAVTDEQA